MSSIFERAVFAAVRKGRAERFELPDASRPRLTLALRAAVDSPDAVGEIERALQLVVAFERTLESPGVADLLRGLLRADTRALELVERRARSRPGLSAARRFLHQQGRHMSMRAPLLPRPHATRGLRVADFLDPAGPSPRQKR